MDETTSARVTVYVYVLTKLVVSAIALVSSDVFMSVMHAYGMFV